MKTLSCLCHSCGIGYELTYNDRDFLEPYHCAGCGIGDDSFQSEVKEERP